MQLKHTSTQIDPSNNRSNGFYRDNIENDVIQWEYLSDYSKFQSTARECIQCGKALLDEEYSNAMYCDCGEYTDESWNWEQWESSPSMRLCLHLSGQQKNNPTKGSADPLNKTKTTCDNRKQVQSELDGLKDSLKRLNEKNSSLEKICQRQTANIIELNTNLADCLAVKRRMEELNNTSYNGSILFKIPHFSARMDEVQNGGQTSIASSVLYSAPNGYKTRVELYLNDDDQSTHLSMSFGLLRGEYDAILSWPFTIPISVCLFDQTGQGRNVVDSFYPDPTSDSFQKPLTDMNTVIRIPKLFPLDIFYQVQNSYLHDDTMFVNVTLDFLETPRDLLSHTADPNPGLPAHVHDAQRRLLIEDYRKMQTVLVANIHQNDRNLCQNSMIPAYPRPPQTIHYQLLSSTVNQSGVSCEDTLS